MSRQRINWLEIFGTDADLLRYCQRRGAVTPTLEAVLDFIDSYEIIPDTDYPQHRPHLSKTERLWLERLVSWRFGYKTYNQIFPSLNYWRERLDVSMRHICDTWRFLLRQGLLALPEGYRRGLAMRFDAAPLLDKVRAWLGIKRTEAVTESFPEVEVSQPALELAGPEEPEPEEEELPEAALVRAPEWDMALPGIEREVGKTAALSLFGIRAYWSEGRLVLRVRDRAQWNLIDRRFKRVFMRHLAGYELVIPCPARGG